MPREVAAEQGTKQAHGPELKLLYLFAGAARKSSLVEQLKGMCARKGISFHAEEVDIERCESHDLTNASLQKSLLEGIRSRKWHVAICTPPCSTFSRVRGANKNGPPPARDAQHFWGYPWLSSRRSQEVQIGNELVRFTCRMLHAIVDCSSPMLALVEHPEDLGMVVRSEDSLHYQPASIWQLRQLRSLAGHGNPPFFTVVFNQCSFGAPYRKPTRLLTNLPARGSRDGPVWTCRASMRFATLQQLVEKPLDAAFKTTGTACYPEKIPDL